MTLEDTEIQFVIDQLAEMEGGLKQVKADLIQAMFRAPHETRVALFPIYHAISKVESTAFLTKRFVEVNAND